MTAEEKIRELLQWRENVPEGRLVNPGLPPFDLLEASEWSVITEGPGELELNCILPEVALNAGRPSRRRPAPHVVCPPEEG